MLGVRGPPARGPRERGPARRGRHSAFPERGAAARSRPRGPGRRDVLVRFGGVTFTPGQHLYADEARGPDPASAQSPPAFRPAIGPDPIRP